MNMAPPALEQAMTELGPWYHRVSLGESGLETPGKGVNVSKKFAPLEPFLPASLEGVRVLDLGCNAGGMAIEFAQRGASVLGIEAGHRYVEQAQWLRTVLGLEDRLEVRRGSLYSAALIEERFDIVLFLGVFYHLRHPQLALDICAKLCRERLFMNTPFVASAKEVLECRLGKSVSEAAGAIPFAHEPRYNWWFPAPSALNAMLKAAGFAEAEEVWRKDEPFKSSSAAVDNTSAYATGQIMLTARAGAESEVDAADALRAIFE
ncbi:MAG: methyltransferase domain-containing protein [Pseudomonadota bacterium]